MENKKQKNLMGCTLSLLVLIILFFGLKYFFYRYDLSNKRLYLSEGIALSTTLKQQLIEIYKEKQSLENFPMLTLNLNSRNIKSVTSNEKGEIRIEYAESIAKDSYLILVPKLNEIKELVWQCGESNLNKKLLPDQCEKEIQILIK